jgi:hypothetical protein
MARFIASRDESASRMIIDRMDLMSMIPFSPEKESPEKIPSLEQHYQGTRSFVSGFASLLEYVSVNTSRHPTAAVQSIHSLPRLGITRKHI